MMKDYTFTNGQSVNEWLDTLSAEDRLIAVKCIKQMIAEKQPLNLLQVKIRMTSTRPDVPDFMEEAIRREQQEIDNIPAPEPQHNDASDKNRDYYDQPRRMYPDDNYEYEYPEVRHSRGSRKKKSGSKAWAYIIVVIIALLVTAFATNPSYNDHKQIMANTITNAATEIMSDQIQQSKFGGMFGNMIIEFMGGRTGNMMIAEIIDNFLQTNLEYHNYVFCSTCTVHIGDEERMVSFGIFGKVFTFDENDIRNAMFNDNPSEENNPTDPFSFFF